MTDDLKIQQYRDQQLFEYLNSLSACDNEQESEDEERALTASEIKYNEYKRTLYKYYDSYYANKMMNLERNRSNLAKVSEWYSAFVEGMRPSNGAEVALHLLFDTSKTKKVDAFLAMAISVDEEPDQQTDFAYWSFEIFSKDCRYLVTATECVDGYVNFDSLKIFYQQNSLVFSVSTADLILQIIYAHEYFD